MTWEVLLLVILVPMLAGLPLAWWDYDLRRKGKRPLTERVWFYKPQLYWYGWQTLLPFRRGGDEWDWHTIVLGWTVTGEVVIATRRCPQTGRCADDTRFGGLVPDWPSDHPDTIDWDGPNPFESLKKYQQEDDA